MAYGALKICNYWRSFYPEMSWTKCFYTCCLWFTYFTAGMVDKQLGFALPDIQRRTHVHFTEASLYISVFSVGCAVGSVIVGFIYRRVTPTCCSCFACTGLATLEAVFPWCNSAAEVYVVNFAIGICYGGINCTVVAELCALWGNNVAIPMLVNFLSCSVGGLTSSAITAPFLSTISEAANITTAHTIIRTPSAAKLYIPFTVTATLTFIAAVSHFILLYNSFCKNITIQYLGFVARSRDRKLSCVQRMSLILIIGTSMTLFGSINNIRYFLPSFLSKQAGLSLSNAVYTLSFYTTFQGIGRFTGFMIVKKIGNCRLLVGHCIICFSSLLALWNCVTYHASLSTIFITVAGIGFGISVLFPSLNSLVEEDFMPITGSVAGFIFISYMVGEILTSALIGYLSETFTPLFFIYTTMGEILLFALSILMAQGCVK